MRMKVLEAGHILDDEKRRLQAAQHVYKDGRELAVRPISSCVITAIAEVGTRWTTDHAEDTRSRAGKRLVEHQPCRQVANAAGVGYFCSHTPFLFQRS